MDNDQNGRKSVSACKDRSCSLAILQHKSQLWKALTLEQLKIIVFWLSDLHFFFTYDVSAAGSSALLQRKVFCLTCFILNLIFSSLQRFQLWNEQNGNEYLFFIVDCRHYERSTHRSPPNVWNIFNTPCRKSIKSTKLGRLICSRNAHLFIASDRPEQIVFMCNIIIQGLWHVAHQSQPRGRVPYSGCKMCSFS